LTSRCKSCGEEIVPTRANRKARIVRESLKAAGSETGGVTYRNRSRGGADQGEQGRIREALAIKERSVYPALVQGQPMGLTWGDLA